MPPRGWRLRLTDILEAIDKMEHYTDGMDAESFAADPKTVDAVIRNLTIMGEAARMIPVELEAKYPEVPWEKMRGIRNVVVHEYFGVDMEIIWQTVRENLPPLVPILEAVLAAEPPDEEEE
jgi:uncharacterized protein with HEPN domain